MQDRQLPFKTWKYEEQTKIKHQVFADYFDKWVKILGHANPLNYIDCFGGKGAYKDGKGDIYFGSPIIAAQIIQNNREHLDRDVGLVIIDSDSDNIGNIQNIIRYKNIRIKPEYVSKDFDVAINNILDEHPKLAPTFFFVDPFGFKIKIATLKRMMEISKSEILLNFMYNGVNRNLGVKDADKILIDLFGTDEWQKLRHLKKSREKEKHIVELFRKKLKEFSRFVYPYRLCFPEMNRTYYYLFHLTNYYLGCEVMKSSFAKHNFGRVEYRGKAKNQMTFLDYENVKIDEVKRLLVKCYKNSVKTFLEILEDQVDETPYLVKHYRHAIKQMEIDGEVTILRKNKTTKTGRPKTSIENQDKIRF